MTAHCRAVIYAICLGLQVRCSVILAHPLSMMREASPATFTSIQFTNCTVRPTFDPELFFSWCDPVLSGHGTISSPFLVEGISTQLAGYDFAYHHMTFCVLPEAWADGREIWTGRRTISTNTLGVLVTYEFEGTRSTNGQGLGSCVYLIPRMSHLPWAGKWLARMDDGSEKTGLLEGNLDYSIFGTSPWWTDLGLDNCKLLLQFQSSCMHGEVVAGSVRNGRKEGRWWTLHSDGEGIEVAEFREGKLDGPRHIWQSPSTGLGPLLCLYEDGAMIGSVAWDLTGRVASIEWGDKFKVIRPEKRKVPSDEGTVPDAGAHHCWFCDEYSVRAQTDKDAGLEHGAARPDRKK